MTNTWTIASTLDHAQGTMYQVHIQWPISEYYSFTSYTIYLFFCCNASIFLLTYFWMRILSEIYKALINPASVNSLQTWSQNEQNNSPITRQILSLKSVSSAATTWPGGRVQPRPVCLLLSRAVRQLCCNFTLAYKYSMYWIQVNIKFEVVWYFSSRWTLKNKNSECRIVIDILLFTHNYDPVFIKS